MKKILLSLGLALVLCWSLSVPALAVQTIKLVPLPEGYAYGNANFHDGLALVEDINNRICGYVDKTGKFVVAPKYAYASDFSEGLAAVGVRVDNSSSKYGFINTAGQVVIPLEYDRAESFRDGLAAVRKDGKYGFIDKTGQVVIPLEYSYAGDFSEGLAPVLKNEQWSFIDRTGKEILVLKERYSSVGSFHNGVASVGVIEWSVFAEKYGYIDRSGKEIVPTIYYRTYDFSDGRGMIEARDDLLDPESRRYGYADTAGNIVIPVEYSNATSFSEGVAVVRGNNYRWGAIDSNGNVVIPFIYDSMTPFHEGLAGISVVRYKSMPVNGGASFSGDSISSIIYSINNGYINLNNQTVVPFGAVTSSRPFYEGAAVVPRQNGKDSYCHSVLTLPGYFETQQTSQSVPLPLFSRFTDVAASSPYVDAIKWAVEWGITSGKTATTFAPSENCTTGQILTFLWRAAGSPEPTTDNPFTDSIPASYQKAAVWAYEQGLVSGTTLGASTPCTRAATVTYLWQLAGSPTASANTGFSDVPADAEYAQAVAWAVENGITSGTGGGQFSPDAACTRGQIVTFLYRAMGK